MIKITIEIDEKTNQVSVTRKEERPIPLSPVHAQEEIRITPKQPPEPKNRKGGKRHGTTSEKICAHCGKPFKPTSNVQKYCPDNCRNAAPVKSYPTTEEIERSQSRPYSELR
jgi:hypothetical protein